jgi:hypothetical protein
MHSCQSTEQFRRPILASFRQKVEEIPDRGKEVYTPVVSFALWPGVKRGFGAVKMMDFAIRFAAEHAEARTLSSVTFDVEIRIETRLAARQQPDFAPSPPPGNSPISTLATNTKFAFWLTCGATALYASAHIVHISTRARVAVDLRNRLTPRGGAGQSSRVLFPTRAASPAVTIRSNRASYPADDHPERPLSASRPEPYERRFLACVFTPRRAITPRNAMAASTSANPAKTAISGPPSLRAITETEPNRPSQPRVQVL